MLKGFHENFMVFNPNKCRFMVVGDQIIPQSYMKWYNNINMIRKNNSEIKPKASCTKESKMLHGL